MTLRQPHQAQLTVLTEARRFNLLCCGRRLGKTHLAQDLSAEAVVHGKRVGWFSPSFRHLDEAWGQMVRCLEPIMSRYDRVAYRIDTITGGVLEGWSCANTTDVGRSRSYDLVVFDEAALIRHLQEIWEGAVLSTLMETRGSAWFMSTPKGKGYYRQLYARGQDPLDRDWASWRLSSYDNPYLDPTELDAMRGRLSARFFEQEILALFVDDAGSVFRRVIEAATATEQPQPRGDRNYILGVDWARHDDWTWVTVMDATTRSMVWMERWNEVEYTLQVERVAALSRRYQAQAVISEINSMGEPLYELLLAQGVPVVPFHTTATSKRMIVEALAVAFEQEAIDILPDPVLIEELQAYELSRLPGGGYRYGAPPGYHDDGVMSLALAWSGIERGGVTLDDLGV